MLGSVAASVGAVVATVVVAALMATAIAGTVEQTRDWSTTVPLLIALAAVVIARSLLLGVAESVAGRAGIRLAAGLRADLSAHLLALGPARTASDATGALATTLVGGLEALEAWARSYRPAAILAVASPLLVVVVVAVVDLPSALVLLITGPVLVTLLGLIGARVAPATAAREREQRWMQGYFADMLHGIATLRAFGRSREQAERIRSIGLRHGESTMAVLRTAFQTSLVLEWGGAVAMALVAVELSLRLMAGEIGFQATLAVLIVAPEFFMPLRRLAAQYHEGAAGREAAIRVLEILDRPLLQASSPLVPPSVRPAAAAVSDASPVTASAVRPGAIATDGPAEPIVPVGDIELERVRVTYPGRAEPALAGVDLVLPAGRRVAVVGASGAGKSTVVALLLRFLDPDSGRVLVGGTDLREVDSAAWRAALAYLPQRAHLFHGTVADNIRLGRPDATDDEVLAAAREGDADAFIRMLPLGYDTPLGEDGVRLSGGQRQRIALARTFLRGGRLVVLDEPTAHLDPEAEEAIALAIARHGAGRTIVVVSHRPALVAGADLVVELDHGVVVR